MMNLMQMLQTLKARMAVGERGAVAVEYALLVSLIAILLIAAVGVLEGGIDAAFRAAGDAVTP